MRPQGVHLGTIGLGSTIHSPVHGDREELFLTNRMFSQTFFPLLEINSFVIHLLASWVESPFRRCFGQA